MSLVARGASGHLSAETQSFREEARESRTLESLLSLSLVDVELRSEVPLRMSNEVHVSGLEAHHLLRLPPKVVVGICDGHGLRFCWRQDNRISHGRNTRTFCVFRSS